MVPTCRDAEYLEIKVIALTAAVMGKETDELLEAGADAVLSKPLKMERLIAALEGPSAAFKSA